MPNGFVKFLFFVAFSIILLTGSIFGISEAFGEIQTHTFKMNETTEESFITVQFEVIPEYPLVGQPVLLKTTFLDNKTQQPLNNVVYSESLRQDPLRDIFRNIYQTSPNGQVTINHVFDSEGDYGYSTCIIWIGLDEDEYETCSTFRFQIGLDLEEINQYSQEITWSEKVIQGDLLENGSDYRKYFKVYHFPENLKVNHREEGYGFGYNIKLPFPIEEEIISIKIPQSDLNPADENLQNYKFKVGIDSSTTLFYKMENQQCFTVLHIPIKEDYSNIRLWIENQFGGVRNGIDLPSNCLSETTQEISPYHQKNMGIPEDMVICEKNKIVFFKNGNFKPVCVKKITSEELIERGWGISSDSFFFNKIKQQNSLPFKTLKMPYQDFIFEYPSISEDHKNMDIYYNKKPIEGDLADYKKIISDGGIRLIIGKSLDEDKIPEESNKIIERLSKTWENATLVEIDEKPGVLVVDCMECDSMFGQVRSTDKSGQTTSVNRLVFYDENGYFYNILSFESADCILEIARTLE